MLRQIEPSSTSETRYFLSLLVCLGALLALKLAAVYAARIDLVLDEAQYWTWSRDLAFGYFSKPPMIAWVIRGASDVCGQSEACIRGVSPVLYTLASFMVYLTGRALYGPAVGFWSAIVFDTLPGLSYSSLLITTDVPLILFWTIALYAWAMLVKRQSMGFAILLGLAIGFGLLAKQAMIYAFLCMACHAAVSREARQALKGGRLFVVVLLAFALFTPFLIWNAEHGFPTVKHTGANIGWKPPFIHPIQLVEYFGLQFGVFGPILFAVLLRASWREIRHASDPGKVLLLSFSLPVLALLCVQALISRAHGNWSATAYPAATILVTAVLLELNRRILFGVSLGLHLAIAVMLAAAPAFALQLPMFERLQFLSRVVGWHGVADTVREKLAQDHYGALLVDTREMAAELLYYLRDEPIALYVWPQGPSPSDQYEMTRPFTAATPEPVLYVSLKRCPSKFEKLFGDFTNLGMQSVTLVKEKTRMVHFCRLANYKGESAPAPEAPAP
jgi:4-amino-4-deoxy-L-arabinose transferase-like glycosyltransferase